jgi:hypothetical protein
MTLLSSENQEIKVGSWVAFPDKLIVRRGKVVTVNNKGELPIQLFAGQGLTETTKWASCGSCIVL